MEIHKIAELSDRADDAQQSQLMWDEFHRAAVHTR
jgi:hypothetical protein